MFIKYDATTCNFGLKSEVTTPLNVTNYVQYHSLTSYICYKNNDVAKVQQKHQKNKLITEDDLGKQRLLDQVQDRGIYRGR